ncbi:MAG: hypothetical protein R3F20_05535 [Planctomycetota bacterium]
MTRKPIPQLVHHRPSGRARVRLNGRDFYLGPWGSPEAQEAYDRTIAEYLSHGRTIPAERREADLTISELILAFWEHAKAYYRSEGEVKHELGRIRDALRPLRRLYGSTLAREFGPKRFRALREHVVSKGNWSLRTLNDQMARVKRAFRWATEEELIPPSVYQAAGCQGDPEG